jgi:hypothetical protein
MKTFAAQLALVSLAWTFPGCHALSQRGPAWEKRLDRELPVLGHRNWIVVADSAYPEQVSPGIVTIYTGAKQLDVLKTVLAALDGTRHVAPAVHLDQELAHVPESLAPGADAYRAELKKLLEGRRADSVPHADLITKLDEAGKTFRVLILKTDLTVPYTSVFLELDCGYWGPEKEGKLRDAMGK